MSGKLSQLAIPLIKLWVENVIQQFPSSSFLIKLKNVKNFLWFCLPESVVRLSFDLQQKPDENHRLYSLLLLRSVSIFFDHLLHDTNQRITFAWRTLESTQRHILFAKRVNVRKAIQYHVPSLEKIKLYLRGRQWPYEASFVWSPRLWRGISMAHSPEKGL